MASILGEFGDQIISTIKEALGKKKTPEEKKVKQQYADVVVRNESGDILILQRSYQDDFMAGKWCLAGGKIEEGEKPYIAASRELMEETAINTYVAPLKTIEKEECVIHYHEATIPNDTLIILDNDEHYRYEFVSILDLPQYDLILDLGDVLNNELIPLLPTVSVLENYRELTPEEQFLSKSEVADCFDKGLITDDDFLQYIGVQDAFDLIKKGYESGDVTEGKYYEALVKSENLQFVKHSEDGNEFYKYVAIQKVDELIFENPFIQ